jgi:hypothetical protein
LESQKSRSEWGCWRNFSFSTPFLFIWQLCVLTVFSVSL